jgi:hypothetical protein
VHALPSAVREVSEVSEVSEREPCRPLRSHPQAVGPPSAFRQLRWLRYGVAFVGSGSRSPSGGKQPDGPRGVGRSLVDSDQRCKERERGDATQQASIITQVRVKSSLELLRAHFVFQDFLGSVEGSIWRVVRQTTPLLVSPSLSLEQNARRCAAALAMAARLARRRRRPLGQRGHCRSATRPPSIGSSTPVTQRDSSEAR